ncbi:unnamed protein product [Orchesella dallaii]|uniref:Protein kinase domain-containing protein n=1 Tax=Orchesella dallaii TaxID=48710 RepID=A0ABP1QBF1_9HEXA
MMSYRESTHFLWSTSESDELGRGSFGIVFRGMNKSTGEAVAVKVPLSNVIVPAETAAREIEVVQRINHVNVVKLLGYEEEKSGRHRRDSPPKVIIMELCDGGSLLKMLEHPQNTFGVDEDEFLTVLRDITSGMKYLRENGIIHRDLKPANIMRSIADDNSSIYKITDFGAARELDEHEEYSSIFGTEEYLHPDVYEQALLPDSTIPKKKFSPSTDLWSIGATLYHVATGMLPFRPDGGRKNRKVMHLMTTKKESGVISAYQMKDAGTVVFEKHLPKNCLLSPDLRKLICPLLAGLMEVDPRKKLTYESYFEKVDEILNRTQFNIFNINKSQVLRLYVNPNETKTFGDLAGVIQSHTKIKPENQILLFKDSTLQGIVDNATVNICSKLPQTSKTNPVILCDRTNTEVGCKSDKALFKKKLFPNTVDYKTDASIASHNCSFAYHIKRQIEDACLKVHLIYTSVQTINHVVVTQLTSASKENSLIRKAVHSMNNQFEMMKGFNQLCNAFIKFVPEDIENGNSFHEGVKELEGIYSSQYGEFQKLVEMLFQLKPSINSLLGSRVQNRFLMSSWEQSSGRVKGVNEFVRIERIANTLLNNISKSYGEISGDLPSLSHRRGASEPEEQCLHLIERTKMIQEMDKLELHQKDCFASLQAVNIVFCEWYALAIAAYIQPEILTKDIIHLQEKILHSEKCLNDAVQHFKYQLGKITESLSSLPIMVGVGSGQNSQNRKESVKAIRARLQELSRVQEEIQSNFKVNIELCDQLQGLLLNSFSESST